MSAVFLKLLNMSITASYFAVGVMILRLILKRTPKWITVLLWGLVGLRLLLPFSIESKQSLIPNTEPITSELLTYTPRAVQVQPIALPPIGNQSPDILPPAVLTHAPPAQDYTAIVTNIWILGMILMLGYFCFSYLRLLRKLREAVPLERNLRLCDHIPSPFLLGFFRPRIYLPSDLAAEDLTYVIAHEEAHLKRKDHWWKPLAFLLLTVYWFNPILWVAYILLCRDIEFACDEKVMRLLGTESKKPYSQALLRCSSPKLRLSACPLAFGEGSVKKRISSILSYKKPTFWIIVASLILCIVLSVGFLTDPSSAEDYSKPILWFDELEYEDDCAIDAESFRLSGFPDILFRRTGEAIQIEKNSGPINIGTCVNAYFSDLNRDGIPELCMTFWGHFHTNLHVAVYDILSDSTYISDQWTYGNYYFRQEGDALRVICLDPSGLAQYTSVEAFICFPTMPDLGKAVEKIQAYKEVAQILHTGEPLLVRDDRSGDTVFAYRTQDALYPFYLSWEGKRLSEMDDEELTAFLSKSIPDTTHISAYDLNAARPVIHEVERDPTTSLRFTVQEESWSLKVYRAALEYYGHPLSSSLPFRDGALTLAHVIELSHKGYALTWEDLLPFKGTDIGSGLYIMEYPINDRYTLMCSDGKLTGSPKTAFLIDSQTGLSIDIRRDLVEGFLLTPTHEKWFDSPDYAGILTATHPTVPDLRFTFDRGKATISIETEGKHRDIILNDGIRNAYFADVTLDGVADLCCSYILGNGTSTAGIVYYDPVNMTTHYIRDSMGYQYALAEREGLLQIRISTASDPHKKEYYDLRSIATGNLPDPMNIGELIEKFPQYFNLDAQHGLVLYVSEYKSDAYACRLISHPGTSTLPEIDLTQLVPCSFTQMIRILSTYRNMEAPLHIVAVETTYSTQHYATPEEYAQALQDIFTLITQSLSPIITHPGN